MSELTPLEQVNADRKAAVLALFPLLTAVNEAIATLDPELFYGGLPQSLTQVQMTSESAKSSLARAFGIEYQPTSGPPV